MAKESSLIHSVSSASLKTLKSFYIVCRREHRSLFFFITETSGYPLQHNPTSSVTIYIRMTVFSIVFGWSCVEVSGIWAYLGLQASV